MCERDCLCKSCRFNYMPCGECYEDSLDKCRSGGVRECDGYKKESIITRIIRRIFK